MTERRTQNGYVAGTMNHFGGDMLWKSTKPKIQDWVKFKALELAWKESEGSRLSQTEWLE